MEITKYTTLNEIKGICLDTLGWNKLLIGLGKTHADDEPLSFTKILEINGIDDAIRSLRVNKANSVRYACECACSVLDVYESANDSNAPRYAIEIASNWENEASEDIRAASDAAVDVASVINAAVDVAAYSAYSAACAADAAAYAAYGTAYNAAVDAADADAGFSKEEVFLKLFGESEPMDEQDYNITLDDVKEWPDTTLGLYDKEVADLRAKLEAAEALIEELKQGC